MFRLVFVIFVVSTIITIYGQTPLTEDDEYDFHYTLIAIGFDWDVFKELAAAEKKNFVFSPTWIKMLIALLYQGSEVYTEHEYHNTFQYYTKERISDQYRRILDNLISAGHDHQLHVGSRMFLGSNLEPKQDFAKIAKDDFRTDIENIDFSKNGSKKIINDWVEKFTNGRITQFIDTEDVHDMMLLIANIVYFKGIFRYEFPKSKNFLGKFNLIRDRDVALLFRRVTVPYMAIEELLYYYEDEELNVKIVRLPFKGAYYSMFVILPTTNESLQTVLKKISSADVKVLFYYLKKKRVRVTLPKFKVNSKKRLAQTLQKLGMYKTFVPSEIPIPLATALNHSQTQIFDVIQKVGIEVDETGEKIPGGSKPKEVQADFEATRSFLFIVQDSPGNILLVGTVENPVEQDLV